MSVDGYEMTRQLKHSSEGMEYGIALELDGQSWMWELGGQQWFPLETILHQQRELAKPAWRHIGYRVVERRKAGEPRIVHPHHLKDAVRLADPDAPRNPFG